MLMLALDLLLRWFLFQARVAMAAGAVEFLETCGFVVGAAPIYIVNLHTVL